MAVRAKEHVFDFSMIKKRESQLIKQQVEKHKQYLMDTREERHKRHRKWVESNPEKNRINNANNRTRRKGVRNRLFKEDWEEVLKYWGNSCAYCGDTESKMTIEHIVAVTKGGDNHKSNIIPACWDCNNSKKAQDIDYWYKGQSFYSKRRMNKIIKWKEKHQEKVIHEQY